MDAPRHARAHYSPRHSRALPTRRYARAITPVTLVGVLALGTVSAVAVPAIHASDSGDDAVASRGERHHAPWGTSGSEGLDDEGVTGRDGEASDDTGGEGDSEHTRSDVGPLAPVGTIPGNPTVPDLLWTPPGTDSPNTASPAPSSTLSTAASQDPSSQVPAPQDPSQQAPSPAAPTPPDPSSQTPAPADSTTPAGSTSTPPSTPPVDPTTPAPPAPSPSTSSGSPTPGPTGPQPPSVPPAPTADPHAMPTGNLPGWTQVFADDFTRDASLGSFLSTYASTWSAYPSPWLDTSGNGLYDPARTLSVGNSVLDIHVHTENGTHLVAAPSPRLPTMTYGRYSVRFRSDPVPGYKTAWLLWPDDNVWPLHGEVDFPEGNLDQHISTFAHFAVAAGGQDAFPTSATYSSWHTATVEWTPGQLVFILDDRVIGTSTTSVPSGPMHWVLQTETQLSGGAPADSASGHVQVDWVTAYTYTP